MSEHSGVKGKTLWQLSRAKRASERAVKRAERNHEQQIELLLKERPGESRREVARLRKLNQAD